MKVSPILAGLLLASAGCRQSKYQAEYFAKINAERTSREATFSAQFEAAPNALKDQLLPLAYFPPDPQYDVLAVLAPTSDAKALPMVYSDGAVRDVRRVGTLEFILNEKRLRLTAFVEVANPDLNSMFVPFGDSTNGTQTYHSGRLLDVRRTKNDLYLVDFNEAFNPSCYYSPTYSCPVPPRENRLPIAVRAGEKIRANN